MRSPLEVFKAMRAEWPAHKPMGIRVSAPDWVDGGFNPGEAVAFGKALKDATSGWLDHRQQIPLAAGYQLPFGTRIRREAGITTMSVGLIGRPQQAEKVVASAEADLVVIGRDALYKTPAGHGTPPRNCAPRLSMHPSTAWLSPRLAAAVPQNRCTGLSRRVPAVNQANKDAGHTVERRPH